MEKILISTLLVLTISFTIATIDAGAIELGFKIGGNLSKVEVDQTGYDASYKPGYQIGGELLGTIISVPMALSLDAGFGIMYAQKGGKADFGGTESTTTINYIHVPFFVRADLAGLIYVAAGPYMSFMTGANSEVGSISTDVKSNFASPDFGVTVRVGHNFGITPVHIPIEFGVDYGLANINDNSDLSAKVNNFTMFVQTGIALGI